MKTTIWSLFAAAAVLSSAAGAQVPAGYFAARPANSYGPFVPLLPYRGMQFVPFQEVQAAEEAAYVPPQAVLPQTSSSIEAKMEPHGQVLLRWQGEPSVVNKLTFSLLDRNKKMIKEKVITKLPAEAKFEMTNKTAYYSVVVEYLNGTKQTVTSLL